MAGTPGLNLNRESFNMFGCVAVKSSAFLICDVDPDVDPGAAMKKMDPDLVSGEKVKSFCKFFCRNFRIFTFSASEKRENFFVCEISL